MLVREHAFTIHTVVCIFPTDETSDLLKFSESKRLLKPESPIEIVRKNPDQFKPFKTVERET